MLGELLFIRGKLDRAARCLQTALVYAKSNEDRVSINYQLGTVLTAQQRFDLAQSRFREALRDNPEYEPAAKALRMLGAASHQSS